MRARLFGTDGIRGRAFEPLDEDTVRRLGAAVAEALSTDGGNHVLLAGDTRASTEVLARWFSGAFLAGGGTGHLGRCAAHARSVAIGPTRVI